MHVTYGTPKLKLRTLDFSETSVTTYVYAIYGTPTLNVEEVHFYETSPTT